MKIRQNSISIRPRSRGCHLITGEIEKGLPDVEGGDGLAHIFLQHTSASLTLNENASPDVRGDLESLANHVIPDGAGYYQHTLEGPDDMSAHGKSSFVGVSLTVPVTKGRLSLGTWQGVYLWEHRDRARERRIVITTITG